MLITIKLKFLRMPIRSNDTAKEVETVETKLPPIEEGKTKRTRRTKEEIERDKLAKEGKTEVKLPESDKNAENSQISEEAVNQGEAVKKDEKPLNTVKLDPLEERCRKWIGQVAPGLDAKICETSVRKVDHEGQKGEYVFVTFSENGPEDEIIDDEVTVKIIKDCLFKYLTVPEKVPAAGKRVILEVLTPAVGTDTPHILCYHEETITG